MSAQGRSWQRDRPLDGLLRELSRLLHRARRLLTQACPASSGELAVDWARVCGTLSQGDTQIADMVERWRLQGDLRAALEWREIDSSALTGDIVWTGQISGESFLITSTWQLAAVTCFGGAAVLSTLREDAPAIARAAVHDAGDGHFSLATVDATGTLSAYRCALSRASAGGLSVSCVRLWDSSLQSDPRACTSLTIDADTVRSFGIFPLGGTARGCRSAVDLATGEELAGGFFGYFNDDDGLSAPQVALCGDPDKPFPVLLLLNEVVHPGTENCDPISSDADWMAATGERRLTCLPALDRVCLWTTDSSLLWLGTIPASESGDIAWRRIEFDGPILALVEHDGLPLCLSEGSGCLNCHRLFPSGDALLLSTTPAPMFGPDTAALLRKRAFATVSRGVLWGWAYGTAFATLDPKHPFSLRRLATSVAVRAKARLISANYNGHALCDASGLVVSGMF